MSPATRCDRIVQMIDQVLDECGVPAVRRSTTAAPVNVAGQRHETADTTSVSGLRAKLQLEVMGPWAMQAHGHD